MAEDRYLFHLESAHPRPHGKVSFMGALTAYVEIGHALVDAALTEDKRPSVVTIARRPDGRIIMFRRLWEADDEPVTDCNGSPQDGPLAADPAADAVSVVETADA